MTCRAAVSPRPQGRGLIEAGERAAASLDPRLSPRPQGRGLIEAYHICGMDRQGGDRLPGRKAGASLKQYPVRSTGYDLVRLPGRKAGASLKRMGYAYLACVRARSPRPQGRGLIEASCFLAKSCFCLSLPGRKAGASLKRLLHSLLY